MDKGIIKRKTDRCDLELAGRIKGIRKHLGFLIVLASAEVCERFGQREKEEAVPQKAQQTIANEGEFIARSQQVSSNIISKGKQPSKLDLAPRIGRAPRDRRLAVGRGLP